MTQNPKAKVLLKKENYNFDDLVDIVEILRGDGGCPWDAEQTHESIRTGFIEETYEVIEAIDTGNKTLMCEELGDVMLQVVFHAQIEREQGIFDVENVIDGVSKKLIHRHPHVFAESDAETSSEVLVAWEKIKNEEKSRKTVYEKLRSVPPMTPALIRAKKVTKKSGKYQSVNNEQIIDDLSEKAKNLKTGKNDLQKTVGEMLLLISALCGKEDIDAEKALFDATESLIEEYKEK